MKRIIRWLGLNASRAESVTDTATNADAVKPDTKKLEKGVLLPDLYAPENDDDTVPNLSTLTLPTADSDESDSFNPYDSGVLQKD